MIWTMAWLSFFGGRTGAIAPSPAISGSSAGSPAARSSLNMFQQTQHSSSPPSSVMPGMARISTAMTAKTMRMTVAAAMPMKIAFCLSSAARPAAAIPMTMTLSPDRTRLMAMTSR